jgi:predicted pyridoxine 5'-phosphate oxidase superfamily flavin-nucleotide-binding protein
MNDDRILEPFHAGELLAQQFAGFTPNKPPIRTHLVDQHRTFFSLLPFICVAVTDDTGWPLGTFLHNNPGFVSSPNASQLRISALPDIDDPAYPYVINGAEIGLLGIDLETRRRNRANGIVAQKDDEGLLVDIRQSFGNCPKYIHSRKLRHADRSHRGMHTFTDHIPLEAVEVIKHCVTMFVASSSGQSVKNGAHGLDISHRGGRPGFLHLQDNVLTIPDYSGNRYLNTLGNLLLEPRASLLLLDFDNGDILQLQGIAEIDWQSVPLADETPTERFWTFRITRGWHRQSTFPFA